MIFKETSLPGVYLIELQTFDDSRGYFGRFWCRQELKDKGLPFEIAQINTAFNAVAGTVRGLHYQRDPHAEAKTVSCTSGRVFDVAVDVRPNSPNYLQWFGAELSAENQQMLFVPEGFAHAYQALEDNTRLLYLVSAPYAPDAEAGLRYDDPAIGINWPQPVTVISDKDAAWPLLTATS